MGSKRYSLSNVQHAVNQIIDLTGMDLKVEKKRGYPYKIFRDGEVWLEYWGAAKAAESMYAAKDVIKGMVKAGYIFIKVTGVPISEARTSVHEALSTGLDFMGDFKSKGGDFEIYGGEEE